MGITPQRNLWQCGPAALKHALLTLGVYTDDREIARIAGTTRGGTNEIALQRAARAYRCRLSLVRCTDPDEARRELTASLRRGVPVLLAIYNWAHWVVAVKEERGKFILMDSETDAVLTILGARQLERRWAFHERGSRGRPVFDLHPLQPRFRVRTRTKFSVARARVLRRPENRELSALWDEYAADLLHVCRVRTPLSEHVMSMGEFLRRHEGLLVREVTYWHGLVEPRKVVRILRNMHFVADTLGMVIHLEAEKRAIAGIAAILALWAASREGALSVYESDAARGRRRAVY
ncbi:MAG: hypothetical protein HY907_13385 [Deltaproteobacteria bacterium]|nr:hypothetical protein [Deltaproteobacteria bacterium]